SLRPCTPLLTGSENRPETPWAGIAILRRKRLSVAPDDMVGITGTPGHISAASASTLRMTSGLTGEGGLNTPSPLEMILIWSSPITRASTQDLLHRLVRQDAAVYRGARSLRQRILGVTGFKLR